MSAAGLGVCIAWLCAHASLARAQAPTPRSYLGFHVGQDSMLASWAQTTGYFARLAAASPRVRVDTLGASGMGRPVIVATISDPANLARRAEIMAAQRRLADPRTLDSAGEARLERAEPAVILIQCSIHSTEVAASQMSMELAYRLATDSALAGDLRNVVVLLIPSPNPDGVDIVGDWYRASRWTAWDGTAPPWLYNAYAGHDDNRDWYMLTQPETREITRLLYRQWFPLVVYDLHQMGGDGARMFVPPFAGPVDPNLDSLLVAGTDTVGTAMAAALADSGLTGVVQRQEFDLWWDGGARTVPARHNMIGILSEAASARLATPLCLPAADVHQPARGADYPEPWTPGCWRIGDIVRYELVTSTALIHLVSRRRAWFLARFVALGRRQIAAGHAPPVAFVLPPEGDPGARATLANVLIAAGVEVRRARAPFTAGGRRYPTGTLVVPMDQPFRAHAKDLLERQVYPERAAYPGGPAIPPYDVAGWTLPLQMGVRADSIAAPFAADLEAVDTVTVAPGAIVGRGDAVLLDNTANADVTAVWRALAGGASLVVAPAPFAAAARRWPAGTLVLRGGRSALDSAAHALGVDGIAATVGYLGEARALRGVPRVGLYRSWNASMDEGWTRWVFEQLGVGYATLTDSLIRGGGLARRFDVIVLPSETERALVSGRAPATAPARYTGGLGEPGVQALRQFVEDGGTVIALDQACAFAIDRLGAPARLVPTGSGAVADRASVFRFSAPGSIFEATVDRSHPIASGYGDSVAVYFISSVILEAGPNARVVLRYPVGRSALRSGFVDGGAVLEGKPALIDAPVGRGRVILFGFRPQHRGQSYATFRLLTNAILYGAARAPARPGERGRGTNRDAEVGHG